MRREFLGRLRIESSGSKSIASAFGARWGALAFAAVLSACGGGAGSGAEVPFPGQIDASFGRGGLFDTRGALGGAEARGTSLSLDGAGRLLAAGWMTGTEFNTSLPLFARILPAGALDPAFGSGGYLPASSPVPRQTSDAWAFPVAAGKVLLVHERWQSCHFGDFPCVYGPLETVVRRVGPDGVPDLSFPETILEGTYARQAIAEPDGAVLLSGYIEGGVGVLRRVGLRRVAADGQPDASFAQNADAVIACPGLPGVSPGPEQDVRIARFANGGILVARWDWLDWDLVAAGQQRKTCITRLNPDGTLDTSYGDGGRVYVNDGTGQAGQVVQVVDVLPLPNGGVALATNRRVSRGASQFGAIQWLAPSGAVDTSRGQQGLMPLGPYLGGIESAASGPDGGIVMAGYLAGSGYLFDPNMGEPRVVRMDAGGQFDAGFGADRNGIVPIKFAETSFLPATVLLSPDGGIHVAGYVYYNGDPAGAGIGHLAVTRLFGGTR